MEDNYLEEGYGDMHRIVLQGIMSAGFLDAKGVKNLFIGACKSLQLDQNESVQRSSMPYVQKVVREINDRVKDFDMAIRSASCELTGRKFYVFLITVEKPIMKLQTLFSKVELDLFQKIMNSVLRKYDNFAVPVTECVNMAREIDATKNFSLQNAQGFIDKMINLQYFAKYTIEKKKDDYELTLGVRTIREFEPILHEIYDDVVTSCSLCKNVMLHGFKCRNCTYFIHKACFTKYFQSSQTCPGCQVIWAEQTMVKRARHEEANDVDPTPTPSSSRGPKSKRVKHNAPTTSGMPTLEPMTSPSKSAKVQTQRPQLKKQQPLQKQPTQKQNQIHKSPPPKQNHQMQKLNQVQKQKASPPKNSKGRSPVGKKRRGTRPLSSSSENESD